MVQIIPERRNPTMAEKFNTAVGRGLEGATNLYEDYQKKKQFSEQFDAENAAIKKQFGVDLSGIHDNKMRNEIIASKLKGTEKNPHNESMTSASAAIDTLESLISEPGIGFFGSINPSQNALFNRGKFNSTLAAVLPVFKSLFPRGMTEKEFGRIMEDFLPKANDSEAKIKGKLDGLRDLVKQSADGNYQGMGQFGQQPQEQERPPLESFYR